MCFFRQIKAVTKFRQIKAVTKFRQIKAVTKFCQIEALWFRKLSFGLRLKNPIGKIPRKQWAIPVLLVQSLP